MAYEAGLLPCRLFSPLSPTPPSFLRRSYLTSRSPSTSQRGVRCELGAVSSSNPTRPMTTTCRSLSQLLPHAGVVHLPGLKTVKAVLGHVPTGMPATNHVHVIKSSAPHYTKRALQTVTY